MPARRARSAPGSRRPLQAGDPRQAGQVRHDRHAPARQRGRCELDDGLALVRPDLEERDAVGRERLRQPLEQRPITASPSGPPSSATRGSNEAATGRPATRRCGRRAGSRARCRTESTMTGGRRSASQERHRSATPWPTAFSRASCSASSETSVATTGPRRRRPGDGARRAARPRSRRSPSRRRRPGAAACRSAAAVAASRRTISASASSTSSSVSGRGMSARASIAKASP